MKKITAILSIIITALILAVCGKSVKTDVATSKKDTDISVAEKVNIIPGNSVTESGIKDIQNHIGQYEISMSGYKGEIFIGIAEDSFYGTIKFFNWGNGVPQPLVNLKVNDDKIYFKRVIKTKEDLIRYGGTAFFEQDFYGIFSADKKTIKGYYRYVGTQDNWEAARKSDMN